MNRLNRLVTLMMVALLALVTAHCSTEAPEEANVPAESTGTATESGFADAAVELVGWKLDGEPAVYVGEELFELINGGAELYHRLGFVRALAADYSDGGGRSIALEVFDMGDSEGAAAVFAEKTGGSGEVVAVGDEALLESYYLNARTGRYLITLTGFESDNETTRGIEELAAAVAEKLGGTS